ncbi:hypothetical protein PILCRDRAFT_653612 [Piloderma croceum F 1598]|uniref:Uncharacterized protein n=1 Tax=Piloderma croceum (strain F 1598) TaxID=765440 RepID=A0A0C3F8N3_PILCF|nr:hypothetical protein PILCRDRAFT_653612 [Piloderma croceum F 1598]
MSSSVTDLASIKQFKFERILNEVTHALVLLGSFPTDNTARSEQTGRSPAILRIEKTALSTDVLREGVLGNYTWLFGWLSDARERDGVEKGADLKINVICPATDVHIRKIVMVHETPDLYQRIVEPYIESLPKSRTQWVENILSGVSEQSKILYTCPEFLIIPDMKWDLVTVSSLYILAIARYHNQEGEISPRRIRSMRDLRRGDLSWLKKLREEASKIVKDRWSLGEGSVRCFIHYQPSYFPCRSKCIVPADHFHVHIANATYMGLGAGMTVGQAWLLDDVISLLELDSPTSSHSGSIMQRMTFTYGLGEQHGLFVGMKAAQAELNDNKET